MLHKIGKFQERRNAEAEKRNRSDLKKTPLMMATNRQRPQCMKCERKSTANDDNGTENHRGKCVNVCKWWFFTFSTTVVVRLVCVCSTLFQRYSIDFVYCNTAFCWLFNFHFQLWTLYKMSICQDLSFIPFILHLFGLILYLITSCFSNFWLRKWHA